MNRRELLRSLVGASALGATAGTASGATPTLPAAPPKRKGINDWDCYTDDWKRTNPDFVVFLPRTPRGSDGYADHFLVEYTPRGNLLAVWTQSGIEGSRDTRVVFSRSEDGGRTWTLPDVIAGPGFLRLDRRLRGSRDELLGTHLRLLQSGKGHRGPGLPRHQCDGMPFLEGRRTLLGELGTRDSLGQNYVRSSGPQGSLQHHRLAKTRAGRQGSTADPFHPGQQPRGVPGLGAQFLGSSQHGRARGLPAGGQCRPADPTRAI